MTTAESVLAKLSRRDIRLVADGDRLRVSAPPGAVSDELRELLARHKADLLSYLSAPSAPVPYAPSSGQRRLWFLHTVDPSSVGYNVLLGWHVSGALDCAALAAALEEVARRDESLRTRFEEVDGEPIAIVMPEGAVPLLLVDASSTPHAERDATCPPQSHARPP